MEQNPSSSSQEFPHL